MELTFCCSPVHENNRSITTQEVDKKGPSDSPTVGLSQCMHKRKGPARELVTKKRSNKFPEKTRHISKISAVFCISQAAWANLSRVFAGGCFNIGSHPSEPYPLQGSLCGGTNPQTVVENGKIWAGAIMWKIGTHAKLLREVVTGWTRTTRRPFWLWHRLRKYARHSPCFLVWICYSSSLTNNDKSQSHSHQLLDTYQH